MVIITLIVVGAVVTPARGLELGCFDPASALTDLPLNRTLRATQPPPRVAVREETLFDETHAHFIPVR
jgi:hypothetical protein